MHACIVPKLCFQTWNRSFLIVALIETLRIVVYDPHVNRFESTHLNLLIKSNISRWIDAHEIDDKKTNKHLMRAYVFWSVRNHSMMLRFFFGSVLLKEQNRIRPPIIPLIACAVNKNICGFKVNYRTVVCLKMYNPFVLFLAAPFKSWSSRADEDLRTGSCCGI